MNTKSQKNSKEEKKHKTGVTPVGKKTFPKTKSGQFKYPGMEKIADVRAKAFEESDQSIVVTDRHANIIYANNALIGMTGYSFEEVLGKKPLILCADHDEKEFYKNIENCLKEKGSWQGEIAGVKKNGETYPAWVCINSIKDDGAKVTHYAGFIFDVSMMKENEQRLQHMAHYDMLTNLPNRSLMYDRLKQALSLAKRYRYPIAVMLLDIDRFKEVNDTLGHHIGDQLLVEVAGRLMKCVRESDTIARMGGDEFLVILPDAGSATNVAHIAQKFVDTLSMPFELEGHNLFVSGSIGITMYPNDADDMNALVKNADTAMYHAKAQGKNNFKFFTEGINKSTVERFLLESRFRSALEKLEFHLNYQPKFDLRTGELTGMEALLRWYHPEQGSVNPGLFIPLAEETGLVVQLGEWVVREACRQTKVWQKEGLQPLKISVNLSARHFHKKDLISIIMGILKETDLDPGFLMIEITESTIIQDIEETIRTLKKIRKLGIGISIDDFGTGFSSLNYLNRFSIDELKIDKTFISEIGDPDSRKVITAIIALAHNLNLTVVAEGVETEEQIKFLRESHCDQVQGYLLGKPLSSEEFMKLVKQKPKMQEY